MFSLEQIKAFCANQRKVRWKGLQVARIVEARNFYGDWLLMMQQLIGEGYDDSALLACTVEKLRHTIQNPPMMKSYLYPFTLGSRDVNLMMDMDEFFFMLENICSKKEQESKCENSM